MPRAAQAAPLCILDLRDSPATGAWPAYSVGEALRQAAAAPAFQSLRPQSVLLPERFRGRLLLRRRNALTGIAISPDNGETSIKCVVPPEGRQGAKGRKKRAAPKSGPQELGNAFVGYSAGLPSAASSRAISACRALTASSVSGGPAKRARSSTNHPKASRMMAKIASQRIDGANSQ
jgi:hypothetical protein